jgi:putative hydrolase of the HAD superfamily
VTYAAVFFDAGETLVHPHPTFPDLFARILQREGYDVDPETIRDRTHVVFDRFKQAADTNELWTTSPERSRRFWHEVYGIFLRGLGIEGDDGLIDRVYAEFTDLANYALFEDVPPTLDKLRDAGLELGVVSNFEEWLEQLLEDLGVIGYFGVRVVSGVEGMEKPDPRIFRLAMDRAGVRPEESVVIRTSRRVADRIVEDGGGVAGDRSYWEALQVLRAEVEHLATTGVVLRDPESGLVDFLGEVDGRRVWLCWRAGEGRVSHYHELDSGFAGRKPL